METKVSDNNMEQYSLQEAQDHLKELITNAQQGKTIVILDENNQAVRLVPLNTMSKPRKAGSAKGLIKMADDFDTQLSDFDEYGIERLW